MLLGCDISHWNTPASFNYDECGDFVIIKASEGATYTDPMYLTHIRECSSRNKLLGLYHYSRAERNASDLEAKNFIAKVKACPSNYPLLALDIEADALNNQNIDEWALHFCEYVYNEIQIMPLIYISAAYAHKFTLCAKSNIGLWLAWYNGEPATVRGKYIIPWNVVAIHQYSSTPYDKNAFFGNKKAWQAYGGNVKYLEDEKIHAGDNVSDAMRSANILAELESIVLKYKI